MNQLFNYFGQAEIPALTLCNPNKSELYPMYAAQNIKNTIRYNALSELAFDYPQSADGGITIDPAYAHIKGRMIVSVEDIGYYIIDSCPEKITGAVPVKSVACTSLESELNARRVNLTGTYAFADLLTEVLNLIPTWTYDVDDIDPSLLALYRTFDSTTNNASNNQTVYNFLTATVEKAYGCIFSFDSFTRKVSAVSSTATPPSTNIYLSFENLIKTIDYAEKTDELCTALHCYGGNGLDIHYVNPLGSNVIYDFSYFKTTEWMSQGLIDALTAWETLVAYYQPIYANLLTQEANYTIQINTIAADLSSLFSQLGSMYSIRNAKLQQGLDTSTVNGQIATQNQLLVSKQVDQANAQSAADSIDVQRRDIVHKLLFTSKISYDNFLSDATYIQSIVKTMIAEWMLVYNNNSLYPNFSTTFLAASSPTIRTLLNIALAQSTLLVNSLTAGYSSYPPAQSDIVIIKGYITDIITTLQSLYSLFQSIIPSTDITIYLDSMITEITAYLDIVSYPGNMTDAQYLELCSYIYENSYANNNIIITTGTDGMTPAEIQAQAQILYDQSLTVLAKVRQPRYEFTGEFSNFIVLQQYIAFTNELELGSTITVKKDDDTTLTPVLLEIGITWDNPTEFSGAIQKERTPKWGEIALGNASGSVSITMSSAGRLDNSYWIYGDYNSVPAELLSILELAIENNPTANAVTFTSTFTPAGAISPTVTTPVVTTPSAAGMSKTYTWTINQPTAGGIPGSKLDWNYTVKEIDAYVVGGTSTTFNIQERTSIGTTGTNLMTPNMTAPTSGAVATTFSHGVLSTGNWLWLEIAGAVGSVSNLVVTLRLVTT